MDVVRLLWRLTQIEALKFWRKAVARVVLVLMFIGPIVGEALLTELSPSDAIYPRVTQFMFSADMLLMIAEITVVLSVLALGNDYELGTVRAILSRGVGRDQYILSKTIASVSAALINGLVFVVAGMASTFIVHIASSSIPFYIAAGEDILLRAVGAIGVIVLVNFVLSGIVMMVLVLSRSSWMGVLAGLYFLGDFFIGGWWPGSVLGVQDAYRYTVAYRALSIMERLFPSDPRVSLPRAWAAQGYGDPGQALILLLVLGALLNLSSILVFRQQDLMTKS
jgi:ABC-type transport system involved in multi-copper enzyme maturation permease subunit